MSSLFDQPLSPLGTSSENPPPDLVGQTIEGRYRVLKCIGEGGMGQVFLAEDVELRTNVALKVLRSEYLLNSELRDRIERECRLMAQLRGHPNIVTLYNRLKIGNSLVLVMEYVDGESLAELISRTKRKKRRDDSGDNQDGTPAEPIITLDERNALLIALQCLEGIDRAHAIGILHRDIKPHNILLTKYHDGAVHAKVTDFGIAKSISPNADHTQFQDLTMPGTSPGSPHYMAPEQAQHGLGPTDFRTDLYSMGITLYEMLTRNKPFTGDIQTVIRLHLTAEPKIPPTLTPTTQRMLEKALQKRPEDRFQSAREFITAIEDCLKALEAWEAEETSQVVQSSSPPPLPTRDRSETTDPYTQPKEKGHRQLSAQSNWQKRGLAAAIIFICLVAVYGVVAQGMKLIRPSEVPSPNVNPEPTPTSRTVPAIIEPIQTSAPTATATLVEELTTVEITATSAFVRPDSSLKGDTIATLKRGDLVKLLDEEGVATKIRTSSGREGWIKTSAIEVIKPTPKPNPKPPKPFPVRPTPEPIMTPWPEPEPTQPVEPTIRPMDPYLLNEFEKRWDPDYVRPR